MEDIVDIISRRREICCVIMSCVVGCLACLLERLCVENAVASLQMNNTAERAYAISNLILALVVLWL